ncbi:hypothetical protein [Alkalihalobacillus pseudalcaliphilus]|uniref:hypothetical protein n=1 Tax=Alkalihalobacillus pseudalcaliphilus TaxID=79884 RepID=UPI00064DF3A7|nr:hypothetical protein [Alkalihalobacillus pseudalcaliphilus]KMK76261.1 hypothetical protein AB990_13715 [Alkalihalobacillus pseudalcaliphilus]
MHKSYPADKSKMMKNNCWYVYSHKLKTELVITSNLEYYYWLLLEMNLDIESFIIRPVLKEVPKKDSPHFWLIYKSGKERYVYLMNNKNNITRFNITNSVYISQQMIKDQGTLINHAKIILPFLDIEPHETDIRIIKKYINQQPKTRLTELIGGTFSICSTRIRRTIFYLILEGSLESNINVIDNLINLEVWTSEKLF